MKFILVSKKELKMLLDAYGHMSDNYTILRQKSLGTGKAVYVNKAYLVDLLERLPEVKGEKLKKAVATLKNEAGMI